MLIQNYAYYLWKITSAGLLSLPGMLSVLLLVAAVATLKLLKSGGALRTAAFWLILIAAVGSFVVAFNNAVYDFDENPDSLVIPGLPAGEPDCGTAWSGGIRGGYGMGNPCPQGCYRGKVVNKQLRMRGMPPWPQYRRELQCWVR